MPDTRTDQRRFPVSLAISIGCGIITAVWLYLQLRVWQEEGHDHMLAAANIFITIFLWVLLSFSIYKNRKDARRAEYLGGEIVTLKDDHKLQLEDLNRKLLFRPPILPWKISDQKLVTRRNVPSLRGNELVGATFRLVTNFSRE
jgi:hypothetical protein